MLHIILFILKITGIILLCILGILLFAVSCALFVPLRYRIEMSRDEGEGAPPFTVRVKVTWLLHLVNILIGYPADVYVRVRIFLFTVFRMPETEKKRRKETEKPSGQGTDKSSNMNADSGTEEETEVDAGQITASDGAGAVNRGETEEAGSESTDTAADTEITEEGKPEPSGFPGKLLHKISHKIRKLLCRIRRLFEKLKTAIQNILYTIRHMCDKMKSASDTIQYYRGVLESDAFRSSWALCKGQAGILLKALKPDKFEADLIVGTGDPASTGEILAVYGMLYPFLGEHVRIAGDFERAHIEGYLFIRGKIRAFTFLRVAWKVYRNKDIRTLIKLFKKEAV